MVTRSIPTPHFLDDDEAREPSAVEAHARRFGRYELCMELASGGMATVFLARASGDAQSEQLVALKRIHPHLARHRAFVEMFLDEARIASRIEHPNVCRVFDYGAEAGSYFIAMEYLIGETLGRVLSALGRTRDLASKPRSVAIVLRLIADACEGLHAAHDLCDARGEPLAIVHRDVSPHNLFVGYDGVVHVVDFGIASAEGKLHQTTTGEVKGKHAYMAPEQLRGHRVDRRADVWSLGVVLWEALTLDRLFRRPTDSETIMAVQTEPIAPPSLVRPELPSAVDDVVLRAVARDPADRYATAREMARDLRQVAASIDLPVHEADVAEWMHQLFPDGLDRRLALVDGTRGPAAPVDGEVPTTRTGIAADADVPPTRAGSTAGPEPATAVRRDEGTPAWVRPLAIAAGLVAAAAAGGALVYVTAAAPPDLASPPPIAAPRPPIPTVPALTMPRTSGEATAPPDAPDAQMAVQAEAIVLPRATRARDERLRRRERDRRSSVAAIEAAPATLGTVDVATPGGWAEVRVSGRVVGQSPARIRLPAGRHTLEIFPNGRGPARRVPVVVRGEQTERVVVPLTR